MRDVPHRSCASRFGVRMQNFSRNSMACDVAMTAEDGSLPSTAAS